jgi:hypothetical protein
MCLGFVGVAPMKFPHATMAAFCRSLSGAAWTDVRARVAAPPAVTRAVAAAPRLGDAP